MRERADRGHGARRQASTLWSTSLDIEDRTMWPFPRRDGRAASARRVGRRCRGSNWKRCGPRAARYVVPSDRISSGCSRQGHRATGARSRTGAQHLPGCAYCAVYKLEKRPSSSTNDGSLRCSPLDRGDHDAATQEPGRFQDLHETPERLNVIEEIHRRRRHVSRRPWTPIESGRSALRCIQLAMLAAGKTSITACARPSKPAFADRCAP